MELRLGDVTVNRSSLTDVAKKHLNEMRRVCYPHRREPPGRGCVFYFSFSSHCCASCIECASHSYRKHGENVDGPAGKCTGDNWKAPSPAMHLYLPRVSPAYVGLAARGSAPLLGVSCRDGGRMKDEVALACVGL